LQVAFNTGRVSLSKPGKNWKNESWSESLLTQILTPLSWTGMNHFILFFILILNTASSSYGASASHIGSAALCRDIFSLTTIDDFVVSETLQLQVAELAPYMSYDRNSLESLYLSLVAEDLMVPKKTLSDLLRLDEAFGDRYRMPSSLKDRQLFYSNSLSSLYSRVAWEWKKQVVETLINEKLGKRLLIAEALMDSYFSVRSFGDRPDSLEGIRSFFAEKEWQHYPWAAVMKLVDQWLKSPESAQGFTAFYRWQEKQTDLPALDFADLQRLFLALNKKPSPVICCKSSYACSSCPHNRAWLKKEED
jgi:hypothetical protein